ncbi:phospholipase D-like domain-containing protein [Clostridium butyricum]|uniref:phospholipase D-like domain-containing protein n=1 Tax=Clostridium butyricum TaxID=1492 RepID=UPI0004217E08|nr:phospholipase D family protein [Clostridium butyricum]
MKFYIQDPIFPMTYSLHEALLAGCNDVKYGAGVFAFVTKGGVDLFLGDQVFENLIINKNGKFKLIVGIDEITNTKTLQKLKEVLIKYGQSLEVLVFMHKHKNTTFHPKFTWFRKENGGVLIVGSNNLTEKGLRRNIEAFNYIEVDNAQIDEIENYFNAWIECNKQNLFSIDDEKVIERAKENERVVTIRKKANRTDETDGENGDENEELEICTTNLTVEIEESTIDDEDFEAWDFADNNGVLVAQIPKSGSRWSQANFDKNTFQTFFGAQAGHNGVYRIVLRSVNSNGKLGDLENRPSVSVASQNYRFELESAVGLTYPTTGRPIAVFINVAVRMYVYILAMPNDTFYSELDAYINHLKGNKMVRYLTDVADIKSKCPNLPLWNITQ